MELEIKELTKTTAKFVVSDVDTSFVNALRRVLISDIPKMAIDDVEFHLGPIRDEDGKEYESVSPLFDEIIAHRLGLIPIPTDLKLFNRRDGCVCKGEGCPNCTIMYSLNKKGPCTVYSGDLEPLGSGEYRVVDDLIPIVKLNEGQALLIYATAVMGFGKEHAKWQVTNGVGYKYYPLIETDGKKCDLGGGCIDACPRGILRKEKEDIVAENLDECTLCNSCVEICEHEAITVLGQEDKFLFKFETDGSISAKDALIYALELIEKKFDDFKDSISKVR